MADLIKLRRLIEELREDADICAGAELGHEMQDQAADAVEALIAENEDQKLQTEAARAVCLESQEAILGLIAERDQLRAEVEILRNALQQVSNEVDGNIRPAIRDLVNRFSGLNNGANPNDLYDDCDRIDAIITGAIGKEDQKGCANEPECL